MKYDKSSIQNRRKRSELIKKVVGIFLIIILYNLFLIMISKINRYEIPSIFGYKAYTISTNSMSPTIKQGDIIIIKEIKDADLEIGDIITFYQNGETITHRISDTKIIDEQKNYITKGDNNNVEDKERVQIEEIQGKYVLKIPILGHVISFLQNQVVILIVILIFLILYFIKLQMEEKKQNRREKKINEDKKNNYIE